MPHDDATVTELREQIDQLTAQVDALSTSAAEAEARAATLDERAAELAAELEAARGRLRESALRYREARLAADPSVPPEMVPEADDIDEVEEGFAAAAKVVSRLRDQLKAEWRGVAAPAGSPTRRTAPDASAMSAAEKIRQGLRSRG